ncbi:hypothetical protein JXA80_03270, partial [bacterium]|nr:hypothetical protein [candidate division CSSED10-310 bacterium]
MINQRVSCIQVAPETQLEWVISAIYSGRRCSVSRCRRRVWVSIAWMIIGSLLSGLNPVWADGLDSGAGSLHTGSGQTGDTRADAAVGDRLREGRLAAAAGDVGTALRFFDSLAADPACSIRNHARHLAARLRIHGLDRPVTTGWPMADWTGSLVALHRARTALEFLAAQPDDCLAPDAERD